MEHNEVFHILICGGRHFDNYNLLESTVTNYLIQQGIKNKNLEIVSGHCPGADLLGEKFSKEHKTALRVFPAQWTRYGKAAGPLRNKEMINYLSSFDNKLVIAFVSPNSKGTRNTIALARKLKINVIEIAYEVKEKK